MINLPFLKKPKSSNKFLVLDINASDVKCLSFYRDPNNAFKIIGTGRRALDAGCVRSGVIIEKEAVDIFPSLTTVVTGE